MNATSRPANAGPTPIIRALYPFVEAFFSFCVPAIVGLYRLLVYLTSRLVTPILILSPIPIILYILSPVFTFCQVLLDVLVLTPVKTSIYALDAVYPVYVFVGVACITGSLLGLGAKWLSDRLVMMVVKRSEDQTELSSSSSSGGRERP